MNELKSTVTKGKKYINDNLRKEFLLACKSEDFQKLCGRLKCDEDTLMNYTSLLQDSTEPYTYDISVSKTHSSIKNAPSWRV